MNNNINQNTINGEDIKKEIVDSFKEWLKMVGINPDDFKEEYYDFLILFNFYEAYAAYIRDVMTIQEMQRLQEEEMKSKNIIIPAQTDKIIVADFGNKRKK